MKKAERDFFEAAREFAGLMERTYAALLAEEEEKRAVGTGAVGMGDANLRLPGMDDSHGAGRDENALADGVSPKVASPGVASPPVAEPKRGVEDE